MQPLKGDLRPSRHRNLLDSASSQRIQVTGGSRLTSVCILPWSSLSVSSDVSAKARLPFFCWALFGFLVSMAPWFFTGSWVSG